MTVNGTTLDDQVLVEIDALIRGGKTRQARKRIEAERRRLYDLRDVDGLRRLEFPAGCLGERGDDLRHAIRQNIRGLEPVAYATARPASAGAVKFIPPSRRRELLRAIGFWALLWPVMGVIYPLFAAAQAESDRQVYAIAVILAASWLVPLGVVYVSWLLGKTDLIQPLIGWLILPLMAGFLFLPYLSRSVRNELPLWPRRSRQG